jgi:hypothetical protein
MIDKYEFGLIIVDGKEYNHDIWIGLSEVSEWWRADGHYVDLEDIEGILDENPEYVIIGTGESGLAKVSHDAKNFFLDHKVPVIIKETNQAAIEYNDLKKQGKRIVALMHLTC